MEISSKRYLAAIVASVVCGVASSIVVAEGNMPPEQTQGAVRYLSGGIGTDEQDAMKQAASSYPLEVQFLARGTSEGMPGRLYTASVGVTIRDSSGNTVLQTTASGPFMLATLPDGDYTIVADTNGQRETRRFRVAQGKHQTLVFEWNS